MRMWIISLFALLVAACTAPPSATPLPTPQLVRVVYPPSLSPMTGALYRCAQATPGMVLSVSEIPASAFDIQQAEITLWLGEPPGGVYAALLARQEILVILNPANPIDRISGADLRALFDGTVTNWQAVGGDDLEVAVWVYPQNNELLEIVESAILPGRQFSSQAWLAPDAAAMLEAIPKDPAAIGALPRAWLSAAVKPVEIDQDLRESLLPPVLALAKEEPQGIVREFLSCLQSPIGQN